MKKVFNFMILMMLLTGALPAVAQSNSISWDDSDPQPAQPLNWEGNKLYISNANDLASYVYRYNSAINKTELEKLAKAELVLTGDIDLSGKTWRPMGEKHAGDYRWHGKINGMDKNGNIHTISNVTVDNYGDHYAGFIDMTAGEVTVENVIFKNCHCAAGGWGNAIVLGYACQNSTVTFNNVKLESCEVTGTVQQEGLLIGGEEPGSTVNISNIEVNFCTIGDKRNLSGKYHGLLIGHIKDATANISNVTVNKNNIVCGDYYLGLIIGWMENACNVTIDNTRVLDAYNEIYSDKDFIGGFIGEAQGNCTIKNSFCAADIDCSADDLGGLVGKTYGAATTLTIENCVVYDNRSFNYLKKSTRGNKVSGGILGRAGLSSKVFINNTVAGVLYPENIDLGPNCGYLVGTNRGDKSCGSVTIHNSYIPNVLFGNFKIADYESEKSIRDNTGKMVPYAFGSNFETTGGYRTYDIIAPFGVNSIYRVNDTYIGGFCVAKMNSLGSCFGMKTSTKGSVNFFTTPLLKADDGMVVSYTLDTNGGRMHLDSVSSENFEDKYFRYGNHFIAEVGVPIKFSVSGEWIVTDSIEQAKDIRRSGKYSFTITPTFSGNRADSRNITCQLCTDVPAIKQVPLPVDSAYDVTRQQAKIKWTVQNYESVHKYWKTGWWKVYKRMKTASGSEPWELSADSIPVSSVKDHEITWTDSLPVVGQTMEYRVQLYCPDLYYGSGDLKGDTVFTVDCKGSMNLHLECETISTGSRLTINMPNSALFDGCRMKYLRWSTADLNRITSNYRTKTGSITIPASVLADSIISNTDRYRIAEKTFSRAGGGRKATIPVTYDDNYSAAPCSKLYYLVVCSDFQKNPYIDSTFVSSVASYQPGRQVEITSFTATKGESTNKIRLDWSSSLKLTGTNVWYTIERKLYSTEDAGKADDENGWSALTEVTNSYTTNTYTDEVMPGYVYKYRILARTACEGTYETNVYEDASTIGYAASRGTIMGKINYNSGASAVSGVDVELSADKSSLTDREAPTYTRYFIGADDLLPLAPGLGKSFWDGNWTLQFLLQPVTNREMRPVLTVPGYTAVQIKDNTLYIGSQSMSIRPGEYNYLMLSHENGKTTLGYAETPPAGSDTYAHWAVTVTDEDAKALLDASYQNFCDTIYFGVPEKSQKKSFNGYLDEVRLWRKVIDNDEVRRTYNRYLTGNETDLAAYYTFDSGVLEYAFDTSHPAGMWNKRHTEVRNINGNFYPTLDSSNAPDETVLCYRGTTDSGGEYQIAGIPFTGEGTNYMVVPVYGTHEFLPAQTRRYISSQSLTHSDVNFTDVSSFPVEVQVNYVWGDYPVEGLQVLIDGTATSRDGQPVVTDSKGKCTVDVPIGSHKLTVAGVGHNFVNGGYPCSINEVSANGSVGFTKLQGEGDLIDFQSTPTAPFTFYDKTLYRLAGRIAGGDTEGKKSLGGGLSRANIGQVELTLEPVNKTAYNINDREDLDFSCCLSGDTLYAHYTDSIQSRTVFVHKSSVIRIKTDSRTGEYLAWIPPVDMNVTDIHTVGSDGGQLDKESFHLDKSPASITYNINSLQGDTIKVDTAGAAVTPRVFYYNGLKSYTYYEDPTIEVTNPGLDGQNSYTQMLGDSLITRSYTEGESTVQDVIPVWTADKTKRDGSASSYMFSGMPVFTQNNNYRFNIRLYEGYHNRDTGKDTHYDMNGVELKIKNTLATTSAITKTTGTVTDFSYELQTDSVAEETTTSGEDGLAEYEFTAGFPNPAYPYALDFSMTYITNGKVYTYPADGTVKGIVRGHVNIPGTDFVTAGPDMVSFVLRDPPGSNSYSWIDQGSTVESNYSWDEGVSFKQANDISTVVDFSPQTYTAIVAPGSMVINAAPSVKTMSDDSGGFDESLSVTDAKSTKVSYTFSKKLQTSSSASFVGSNGDVYLGNSTNLIYADSRNVDIVVSDTGKVVSSQGRKYAVGQFQGSSMSTELKTTFAYTQSHILNVLIPNLREQRRKFISRDDVITGRTHVVESLDGLPSSTTHSRSEYYVLSTTQDSKSHWTDGVDYKFVPATDRDEDSLLVYGNYIENWEKVIECNDSVKYNTANLFHSTLTDYATAAPTPGTEVKVNYGYMGNVSLDAGSSETNSMTRTYSTSESSKTTHGENGTYRHTFTFGKSIGTLKHRNSWLLTFSFGNTGNFTRGTGSTKTQTFGYTLSDANAGDYFSIDTYLPGMPTEKGTISELTESNSRPCFDEFYVFRLRGGQSKCPYQEEEYSKYYMVNGKYAKIGDGTIPVEQPRLTVGDGRRDYNNVPNGQPLYIPVTISNTSTANVKVAPALDLTTTADSNPDGLDISIDGVKVTGNSMYQVLLMPGESVSKTLCITQQKNTVLDYNNVVLRLYSDCQAVRGVTDTLNIHFKPISSPVVMKQTSNVINKGNVADGFKLNISDIRRTYDGFTGVSIQYKAVNDLDWKTCYTLVNDSTATYWQSHPLTPGQWEAIADEGNKLNIAVDKLADGRYNFRAESFAISGSDYITNYSDTITVLKDTKAPELFNKPSGYYDGTSDIEVQFTEALDQQLIKDGNFYVTGVLNDPEVKHSTGLHFAGNTPAKTGSRINIAGVNSTVGFWYKPVQGQKSCLFSQIVNKGETGQNAQEKRIAVYYNADNTMTLRIGDSETTSTAKASGDDWMYAAVVFDTDNSSAQLYNLYGTSTEAQSRFVNMTGVSIGADANVPLYVGGEAWTDDANAGCHADMESFVVYDGVKSFAEIAADKSSKHTANTRGLLAYWPMDEGAGTVAKDKVRQRNLTLSSTDGWYLPVTNYALRLDGSSQYMKLNTSACPIASNSDYVLEFWFRGKGGSQSVQTLFSNGWGGTGSTEQNIADRLSLSLGTSGQIILEANSINAEMGSGYNDGQWHHLAMNVQRDSYLTIMVDTIDISGNTSIAGSAIGGFANANMTVGARRYQKSEGEYAVDRYFNGEIDEIRIWNAYKTQSAVRQRAHDRLTGSEPGLVAYYPFERTALVANQQVTSPYMGDRVQKNAIAGIVPAAAPEYVNFPADSTQCVTDEGPRLHAADFIDIVEINWKSNGSDRIVLSFPSSLSKSRIEKCTLNFTAQEVYDEAGNMMEQPYTWSVYVNQNPLSWYTKRSDFNQCVGSTDETTIYVVNSGNTTQTWSVSDVPSWAHLSQTSGVIKPYDAVTLTLTTDDNTSIGNYHGAMYLCTDDGMYVPLYMSLAVTGNGPGWTLDETDGSVWMSVFGRLKINDVWSTDENDIVGAFTSDGRCLALGSPKYDENMDTYFLQLNIRGNGSDAGRKLSFQVWDASTGVVYTGVNLPSENNKDSVTFVNQSVKGSFTAPYIISTKDIIRQTIEFRKGWNWFSLWVENEDGLTASSVLGDIISNVAELKQRISAVDINKLEKVKLHPAQSYHIYMNSPATLVLEGKAVDPATVQMTMKKPSGGNVSWMWLGYSLTSSKSLGEAFADFTPVCDDIVKGENAFAMYNGSVWVGELKSLSPGKGYVYGYHGTGTGDTSWHYPNKTAAAANSASSQFTLGVDPYSYEDYTNVEVTVMYDSKVFDKSYRLAAFDADGVCRGVADGEAGQPCQMAIYGEAGETYTFRLMDSENVYDIADTKDFDSVSPEQKLTLRIITTGINRISDEDADTDYYSVSGIKFGKRPQRRGVYIHGSSKELILKK